MRSLLSLAAVAILLTACETADDNRAATTEVLLAAAGFDIKKADTAEQQSAQEALKQRWIVRDRRDGETVYIDANASSCGCLCIGSGAHYERYRALAETSQAKGVEKLDAVDADQSSEPHWSLWSEKTPAGHMP